MKALARVYRACHYARITTNPKHLALLSNYRDVYRDQIEVNAKGSLVLKGTNVNLQSRAHRFLLQGVVLADELRRCSGAEFDVNGEDKVVLTVHGVRLVLTCWEELFIAHEVFHRKLYNISLQRPFHVIDVGMNTGTSALFFASMAGCERVVGYELFQPTLHRARENIALNPTFGEKIQANAYGLGPKDERLVLDYFPEYKGSLGRSGLPQYARPTNFESAGQREAVEIRAIVPVLNGFLADSGDRDVVCKIDCEGAEYEIMSSLAQADLLRSVSAFLIEWHLRGAEPLKKVLIEAGFNCLSLEEDSENHGMLYAFRDTP